MNAVRLPVNVAVYNSSLDYKARVTQLIDLANRFELLVILEVVRPRNGPEPDDIGLFWADVAARFSNRPNLFFAPLSPYLVRIIRQAGALQPVLVKGPLPMHPEDPNTIYEINPPFALLKTDADRAKQFFATSSVPVIVNGLDPEFGHPSEDCKLFPADPAEATALVEANLTYFDEQQISWTLSSFTPGKLITDYRYFNGTKLDPGWTCTGPNVFAAGLGMVLLSHLWSAAPHGLFTVSESRGGMTVARGAISTAYGPILADKEMSAHGLSLPAHLGNVSVRVTDSRGVSRQAALLHTGAGWAFISFVLPDACAIGPAEVAVVRTDGSPAKTRTLIVNLAPALLTSPPDGRSIAVGQVTQRAPGKTDKSFPTSKCGQLGCRAVPIPLSRNVSTTIRLVGTGFR